MTDFIPLFSSMLGSLLVTFLPLVLLIFCIRAILTPTESKGERGERFVSKKVLGKLDPLLYTIHDDVYLPRPDGKGTTQVDHVVVSPYGVFVIETKNMKGWIFGDVKSKQWTQLIYGKKYRFQNPLHQNSLHLNALKLFLGIPSESLKNVVFFVGEVSLKTVLPANVLTSGLRAHIQGFQEPLICADECDRIRGLLDKADPGKSRKIVQKEHLNAICERNAMGVH